MAVKSLCGMCKIKNYARESRLQYCPEFGDGTPSGVRDGRPTRENWLRAVTPRQPNRIQMT